MPIKNVCKEEEVKRTNKTIKKRLKAAGNYENISKIKKYLIRKFKCSKQN